MRQRGFTLVELMVTVALIGILAAMAVAYSDPSPRVDDVGQVIAAMAREAGREAVSRGSVRDDVAVTMGTARSRLLVTDDGAGVVASVEVLVEHPVGTAGGDWVEVGTHRGGRGITLAGSTSRAVLEDGDTPEDAYTGTIELDCQPEGICTGGTFYLTSARGQHSRVAILPLGGAPMTFLTW